MNTLVIPVSEKIRLDVALAATLKISRSAAQHLIKTGRVVDIEGKPLIPHLSLTADFTVLQAEEAPEVPLAPPPPLDILYEDEQVVVVNKPAGLLVHQAPGHHESTLLDALLLHAPQIAEVGEEAHRHGIVHRLDKEASGVLIVAKTAQAFTQLKTQFAERLTQKVYDVLVYGKVADEVGTITFPIARSRTHARMAARAANQEGKDAITHYEVTERYSSTTRLRVRIETGRTHQIRAHMLSIGHPVVGDRLYLRKEIKAIPLPRLFLHAAALTITLPGATEPTTFTAPLPAELTMLLSTLKKAPAV